MNRILKWDILKVLGLFSILFAHAYTENTKGFIAPLLFQLRNFDVPLMVIISGAVFTSSSITKADYSYFNYIKKRVWRILKPVWIFLIFHFSFIFIVFSLINKPFPYDFNIIKDSFFLTQGIGFVWIFRVFCLVAIVAPLLIKLLNKISDEKVFIGGILFFYLIYELIISSVFHYNAPPLINLTLFYIVPYSVVFALGIVLSRLSTKIILLIAGMFFLIFVSILSYLAILNLGNTSQILESIYTEHYKFPPRLYYFSYAIFMSLVCYLLVKNIDIKQNNIVKIITFISSSSISIYLWHIVIVFWKGFLVPDLDNIFLNFIIISGLSLLIAYAQTKIVPVIHHFRERLIPLLDEISQKSGT